MRNVFLIACLSVFCFISCKTAADELKYENNKIENLSHKNIITAVIQYYCDSAHPVKTQVMRDIEPGEIRYLDSSNNKCTINKIRSAYYDELPDTSFFKNLVQVVAILVTGVITLLASVLIFRYQQSRTSAHELEILIDEMEDIQRHFDRNLKWIKRLDLDDGLPSDFYIKRLRNWKHLLINSEETYKTIPRRYTKYVAHTRLLVRNADIETASFLKYMKNKSVTLKTLKEHFDFIKTKHEYTIERLGLAIKYLKKPDPTWEDFDMDGNASRDNHPMHIIRIEEKDGTKQSGDIKP